MEIFICVLAKLATPYLPPEAVGAECSSLGTRLISPRIIRLALWNVVSRRI
jgi:hypothetical protein